MLSGGMQIVWRGAILWACWGERRHHASQVVSSMIGASLHLLVGKSHIHTPMHANALIHALSVRRQAADIGAPLG